MLYEAKIYQMEVENHLFWIAESKVLKGCVGQGDTSDEALRELEENEKEWLDTAKEFHIPIPPQTIKKEKPFRGKFSLRMSPYVHEQAAEMAEELGSSLNQFINDAIISYTHEVRSSFHKPALHDNTPEVSRIIVFPDSKSNPYQNVKEKLEEM